MKKHRNFLIFYSLWLATIFALLTIFDSPQEKILPAANQNMAVCTLTKSATSVSECAKCLNKLCCVSNTSFLDYSEEEL